MKTIAQREARRLRKRVNVLEAAQRDRERRWSASWPGGTVIATAKWDANVLVPVAIRTARALGHAVVVTADDDGLVRFHGCSVRGRGDE
jgi:hypothetical protein